MGNLNDQDKIKDKKETSKKTSEEEEISEKQLTVEEKLKNTEDKLLRSLAELENQRNRFEREIKEAIDFGGFNFARENLATLDNLQSAYSSIKSDTSLKENKDSRVVLNKFISQVA